MKKYVYKGIKMTSIYNKLKQLQYKEDYPFHMPGHKRNLKIDPLLDAISKLILQRSQDLMIFTIQKK